jgi:two-component sensor histidine kinase
MPSRKRQKLNPAAVPHINGKLDFPLTALTQAAPKTVQRSDRLDRLASLSGRIQPYSSDALWIGLACLAAATILRFVAGWTGSDLLFATYLPAILAAGLLAGIPAAVGVTVSSALIVWLIFVPPYLQFGALSHGEFVSFIMYLIAASFTICFAHYCRVVLKRLHERNLANEILAKELQHRNRNLFAVIDVILQKTLADEPERAKKIFGRIRSIMYANELLTSAQPQLLTLKELLLQAFAPYGEDRLEARGPELSFQPDFARHLILLVHELVTNAAKYGSLSQSSGRVFVDWRHDQNVVTLNWKESGGPKVETPTKVGFGSELMSVCIRALSGSIQPKFASDGFGCSLTFKVGLQTLSR